MNTASEKEFVSLVEQRHAVKHFDSDLKMSREEIMEILNIAQKAPSSWNLQHWNFLVFDEQEAKGKLFPIAYNQQQIVQASTVIAILGDLEANKNAEPVFGPLVEKGYISQELKDTLIGQIEGAYTSHEVARDEAVRNSSLAAMQLMLAAQSKGYDTCPMGGFDRQKLVEVFGVPTRYIPVMLISIGKSTQPARPSARLDVEKVTHWNRY